MGHPFIVMQDNECTFNQNISFDIWNEYIESDSSRESKPPQTLICMAKLTS